MIGATALSLQTCQSCLSGEPRRARLRACTPADARVPRPAGAGGCQQCCLAALPHGDRRMLPPAGAQLREWFLGGTSSGDMQATASLRLLNVTAEALPGGGLAAAFVQVT